VLFLKNTNEYLKQLLTIEWNGKPVWKSIRDGELTFSPAFKGTLYDKASVKIMYVGHAVNGWAEFTETACPSLEKTIDTILNQQGALDTFVNQDGYPYIKSNGKTGVYRHINSKFFRLIKQILEYQNESDSPTTEDTWYNDKKNWNQKFIWSNLYCIAPSNGGNPKNDFIKSGMSQYIELIKAQIEEYKPNVVIFCPLSGYFTPWKRLPSFADILDSYKPYENSSTIIATGHIDQTQIIVCKRPDARGKSFKNYEDVQKMAKEISDYINSVCK